MGASDKRGNLLVMTLILEESRLRHPAERPVFILTLLLNLGVIAAAVALIHSGGEWLERYPRIGTAVESLRVAAGALLFAPFALTLLRNQRRAAMQANAVHLGRKQMAAIHEDYRAMCETLHLHDPPELYIADNEIDQPSAAYSAWDASVIILNPRFFGTDLSDGRCVYRFFLARELGRVRLGHTHWLDELLIAYVIHIPILRNPLLHMRTYSHDRYAAWLAPDAVRGLVVLAASRRMLASIDVDVFLRQARSLRGWRPQAAQLLRNSPYVALRIQALDRAGLVMTDGASRRTTAGAPARVRS